MPAFLRKKIGDRHIFAPTANLRFRESTSPEREFLGGDVRARAVFAWNSVSPSFMATLDPGLNFAGVVLAAGRSTRMGCEKALLVVNGQPLWERQYALLAASGAKGPRYLSVRPEQTWAPMELLRVADAAPNSGPLGGIVGALRICPCSHLLVLAVDLPEMVTIWFEYLRGGCDSRAGAIGQHTDGSFEPLAAIYPRALCSLAEAELNAGRKSLQLLARRAMEMDLLRVRTIQPEQTLWFENWNTPNDLMTRSS